MQITRTHLADGRELIYFDEEGSPKRSPSEDSRTLEERHPTAGMRYDVLSDQWVSIATARQGRAFLPPKEFDPLAPQSPTNPSEIPDDYQVVVFENRSPSFGPLLSGDSLPRKTIGAQAPSVGRCEVVCFNSDSDGSFASQTTRRARTIIDVWANRTEELSTLPGIAQVYPFENRGTEIGVTLSHPHGQIYAYPFVPEIMRNVCRAVEKHGSDIFQRILDFELASDRVVLRCKYFSAFVPFAARWPVEIHLMPHRHIPDIAATTHAERDELAVISLKLTRSLDQLYGTPLPYIGSWMQAPVHEHRDDVRLTWRLISPRREADKLKYLAGSESGMGAWIGDVAPEAQAVKLRDALVRVERNCPVEKLGI